MNTKKTGQNIIIIATLLVFALLNVILFLTVDDARIESGVFWVGWAFAFPVNLAALVIARLWCGKKGGMALVQLPVAYRLVFGFGLTYLVIGVIFMYAAIENVAIALVTEAVVSVAYIIIAMYAVFAATHIMQSEREVKAKVAYISVLKADVEDVMMIATDGAVKNALLELSECVRFSDPMSHPSLGGVESQISAAVARISSLVSAGNNEEAVGAILETKNLLEARNRRCIMLK